jgi:hypothetical protein
MGPVAFYHPGFVQQILQKDFIWGGTLTTPAGPSITQRPGDPSLTPFGNTSSQSLPFCRIPPKWGENIRNVRLFEGKVRGRDFLLEFKN